MTGLAAVIGAGAGVSRGGACNRCQDPAKRPIGEIVEIVEIVDQLPLRLRLRSRSRSRSRGGGPIHGRATDYATVHELLISHDLRKLHDRSLSDRAAPFAKCLMHIAHRARLAARGSRPHKTRRISNSESVGNAGGVIGMSFIKTCRGNLAPAANAVLLRHGSSGALSIPSFLVRRTFSASPCVLLERLGGLVFGLPIPSV